MKVEDLHILLHLHRLKKRRLTQAGHSVRDEPRNSRVAAQLRRVSLPAL